MYRISLQVSINTNTFNIQSYSLPFTLGSDKEKAYKTSLVSCNSIPYIFAEGKVFTIENNSIVPLSTIAYTFGSDTFDYSTIWDEVSYIKSFRDKNTNKNWLLIGDFFYQAKPEKASLEILE